MVAWFAGMLGLTSAQRHAKALHAASERPCAQTHSATIVRAMADQTPTQQPLDQQLQEIGAQLAWVRDYL